MPKKQKRFTSEKAILKAIDAMEERRVAALVLAEEREADVAKHPPGNYKDFVRKEANSARRSAQLAVSKKVELGKALAAFRTMPLALGINDNSVVL